MDLRNFLQFLVTALVLEIVTSKRHLVYWNGKIIPRLQKGGLHVTVEVDDWMDVVCPYYADEDARTAVASADYLFIYNVTEYDFNACDTRRGLPVQVCDDPLTERKLTTKFQERSPSPFGFTFRPGETYYYISKPMHGDSSKGCTENTLKMIVNVEKRGTVYDPLDRAKIVYHETSAHFPNEKTVLTSESSRGTNQRRHHHHHHHRPTTSTTTTTTVAPKKSIFRVINTSRTASHAKNRRGHNPGSSSTSALKRTNLLSVASAALILCWYFR